MITDDLSVFFDTDDFAIACTRWRGTEPPIPFMGILSEIDQEALQSYVVGTVRELQYPYAAVELLEGDEVVCGAETWRVARDGRRVNDGGEGATLLTKTGVY